MSYWLIIPLITAFFIAYSFFGKNKITKEGGLKDKYIIIAFVIPFIFIVYYFYKMIILKEEEYENVIVQIVSYLSFFYYVIFKNKSKSTNTFDNCVAITGIIFIVFGLISLFRFYLNFVIFCFAIGIITLLSARRLDWVSQIITDFKTIIKTKTAESIFGWLTMFYITVPILFIIGYIIYKILHFFYNLF